MEYSITKKHFKIMGRTVEEDNVLYLSFSAGFIEFETETNYGAVTIVSNPEKFNDDEKGVVAIYLNDSREPVLRQELNKKEQTLVFFDSDTAKKLKVKIVKMSEAVYGLIGLKTVTLGNDKNGNASVPVATPYKSRKLEIIGDSITCGYGNEGSETSLFNTREENPQKAYAVLAAELLDADYQLISRSGIGVTSCYVDESINEPLQDTLIKEVYEKQDYFYSMDTGKDAGNMPADFDAFMADTVIINIGTNDGSYCREHEDRKAQFRKDYRTFLDTVIAARPYSKIVCTLGLMDQRLCQDVLAVISDIHREKPECNISFLWMEIQDPLLGIGTDFHPSLATHQKAAKALATYLGYGVQVNQYTDSTQQ